MRRIDFLVKLRDEGRLDFVKPTEEICRSYIEKSESNMASARILLETKHLEEAVSLAYYSMYHMLTALLFRTGIKCENHSASIILLKGAFGIDNSDIKYAKRERIDKQYYVDFSVTSEDVISIVAKAEEFNGNLLDFISRLGNKAISEYRERISQISS